MSSSRRRLVPLLVVLLVLPATVPAQNRPEEPLVERVRAAIDKGVRHLRSVEKGSQKWEQDIAVANTRPGGESALALVALLNAGVKPNDPVIERGLEYLRRIEPKNTYVVGLQTMVYAEVGDPRDGPRIQNNVDWLLRARVYRDNKFQGWGYQEEGSTADNSNTQYALLGLHAGKQAGAKIDRAVWQEIQNYYVTTQAEDGGWIYSHWFNPGRGPTLTMTVAGLCGMYITAMELNDTGRQLNPDGSDRFCGQYEENQTIAKGHRWLGTQVGGGTRFAFQGGVGHIYYNIYGIERLGRLSGQRFLAGHDWYREGCEFLVDKQQEDGAWFHSLSPFDKYAVVSTSFALLFLSKGRTPILVSKFAHDPGEDWNRKHNDLRHVVEYTSKELFRKQPLAWQNYDSRRLDLTSRDEVAAEVGSLLQSPIVFLSGHEAPRLTEIQKTLLKRYIDEGGFLFAEACCGDRKFTAGFRQLMGELFKETPLKPLGPAHPIWTAHAPVPPNFVGLEGIEMGCKTVVVFSPQPLAGNWEVNDRAGERGQLAFRLAGNIVAYATGLEYPKPRLTTTRLPDAIQETKVPRGYRKVAQIRHGGDWQPAPRAMSNLMRHVRSELKLDVALAPEEMTLNNPSLSQYKFLYMHGRRGFDFGPDELKMLQANLNLGGLLFADACCGKKEFDQAFRAFVAKLFPESKLEPIPPGDYLFSAELNGSDITTVRVRRERPDGTAEAEFRDQPPQLEGIKIKDRWVVIYSRYDIGCALENHQSSDCKGHDHASALRLGTAAVLYSLKK
jgi:hypothetical protein